MIRFILRRLIGAVLVVFCVFTLSFVIMRLSPGSPFDEEKELPPAVVANQAQVTGMAAPVPASVTGTVTALRVQKNESVSAGQVIAIVDTESGPQELKAEDDLEVFRVIRRRGERVEAGQPILFRKTGVVQQ